MRKRHLVIGVLGAAGMASAMPALAVTATRTVFGHMRDGRAVYAITLRNQRGIRIRLITYGARVQEIMTPDRNGHFANVALGYRTLRGYLSKADPYFGATVGRYANRISKGRFRLNGHTYQLSINDGPNSLHGGKKGFDRRVWTVVAIKHSPGMGSVIMRYVSPNGQEGYPGTLTATVTYSLSNKNQFIIHYRATTNAPTIVNLSNHTYWNLSGEGTGSILNEVMMIPAGYITPTDATQIPTGVIRSVVGTPFDFRRPKRIGRDILNGHSCQLVFGRGYDMNWVFGRGPIVGLRVMAKVVDPASGRVLTLQSNQPGLQFYTGNYLNGTIVGTSGHIYRQGDAFVLEPQLFPDTPNHANFGSAELNPGQVYRNNIVYTFSTTKAYSEGQ